MWLQEDKEVVDARSLDYGQSVRVIFLNGHVLTCLDSPPVVLAGEWVAFSLAVVLALEDARDLLVSWKQPRFQRIPV